VADNIGVYNGSQAIIDIVNLLKKETQATTLQPVPFDIYSNAASTIQALRTSAFEGLEGLILESLSKEVRSKQIVIMFLKPMEQFMGVDFNKYGPFLKEDIAALPAENARSLIESKIATELHSK
jgi:DNA replication initiation complex subunit (GINS family)